MFVLGEGINTMFLMMFLLGGIWGYIDQIGEGTRRGFVHVY